MWVRVFLSVAKAAKGTSSRIWKQGKFHLSWRKKTISLCLCLFDSLFFMCAGCRSLIWYVLSQQYCHLFECVFISGPLFCYCSALLLIFNLSVFLCVSVRVWEFFLLVYLFQLQLEFSFNFFSSCVFACVYVWLPRAQLKLITLHTHTHTYMHTTHKKSIGLFVFCSVFTISVFLVVLWPSRTHSVSGWK